MEIVIKNLHYSYNANTPFEKEILSNLSLNLSANVHIAIIGPTGSGKSTLIQHLNGLNKPARGSIQIGDITITSDRKKIPPLFDKVGMVFQFPEHQLFEQSVIKDIGFGPRNLGWSEDVIRARSLQALKQVGLDKSMAERSPFQLSGGEKRKVAIAGILVMNPSVLILDEPTVGLDKNGRDSIIRIINDWQKEDERSVIMITHDMDDVANLADEVIVMENGTMKLKCDPLTLFTSYREEIEALGLALPRSVKLVDVLNAKLNPAQLIQLSSVKMDELIDQIEQLLLQGGDKS